MKKLYTLFLLVLCLAGTQSLYAQCTLNVTPSVATVCSGSTVTLNATATPPVSAMSLLTTMSAGNNHRGNMFDIQAINTVTITSFDASPMGNTTIAIYYKTGTWVGFANSPSSWTLVGSAAVTAQTPPTATPVPVPVNVTIPAGQTYAFYVTSTNTAVSLNYTDGTAVGNTFASDANISFKEGAGMEYPFTAGTGSIFTPRVWNGYIHYTVPITSTISYLWSTSATSSSITPTVNTSTQYTVQATVSGCPSTLYDTVNIAVSVPPVNAGPDATLCAGTSATLSGSGAVNYTWDNSVTDGVPFTPVSTMNYIVTGTDSISCTNTDTVLITVNPLPNVSAGADMPVCMGSPVTLSGSGAVSYSWDNSVTDGVAFTPVSTMSYIVTGTDANACTNRDTVLVTVNPLPNVSAGQDATVCAGSAVTLAGAGAVSYSWDNNVTDNVAFTPASTMNYIVSGTDANGCTNTDTVMVTVNALPAVNAGADQAVCAGSTVTLAGAGAVAYSWDNNVTDNVAFTPVSTMSYILTGTGLNGCMNNDTVLVTVNTLPTVSAGADQTVCANYPLTLSGSGAVTYNWNNSVTNGVPFMPVAGNYIVTGTDANGCFDSDTVNIAVNTVNVITSTLNETITAAAGATAYQWINCSNNAPISGATSSSYTATSNGSYAVIITAQNGCIDTSDCQAISSVGIENYTTDGWNVFPNPTNGKISIRTGATVADLVILQDVSGKTIASIRPDAALVNIDLSVYADGVYFVRIEQQGNVKTIKLVKN